MKAIEAITGLNFNPVEMTKSQKSDLYSLKQMLINISLHKNNIGRMFNICSKDNYPSYMTKLDDIHKNLERAECEIKSAIKKVEQFEQL